MTKENLTTRGGRFTSLRFRQGTKQQSYCAKIIKVTPHTIQFKDVNSGEIVTKNLKNLEA